VLYLGIGTGRLARPLEQAGIHFVGVDAHAGMLDHARRHLVATDLVKGRIEDLDLRRQFDLVMVPSNILYTIERLRGAAAHVGPNGVLAFELANPHWLESGAGEGVRVSAFDGNEATLEVDYVLENRQTYTQVAEIALVWPDETDRWLSAASLTLQRMFGRPDGDLRSSPTYFVEARQAGHPRSRLTAAGVL
jgi:2-polyprenyl-3-methyl-5-hydroxy-6-metoxy-1,4-benzoquinol methylase